MTDILNYIASCAVLKWVILVLIVGFIGQFGKMMAESIVTRVRLRRSKEHQLPDDVRPKAPSMPLPDAPQANLSPKPDVIETPDKKALKIMAKARKKEAKKN